jgi:nucleoside-triphosphatase THEP1
MKQVQLLTGRPGTGKTSLIKQVAAQMKGRAGGFYTEEIRTRGTREGFRLVTLDGEEVILAHVNIHSQYRVGKYGVDIDGLERIGVPALHKAARYCDLVVIDEIGKMELFSANFREAVARVIDSGKRVLGTIMLNSNPWADAIKRQPQVNLLTVSRDNYHQVLEGLLNWLKAT